MIAYDPAVLHVLLSRPEGRVPWPIRTISATGTIGVGHLVDRAKGGRLPEPIIDALLEHDICEVGGSSTGIYPEARSHGTRLRRDRRHRPFRWEGEQYGVVGTPSGMAVVGWLPSRSR